MRANGALVAEICAVKGGEQKGGKAVGRCPLLHF